MKCRYSIEELDVFVEGHISENKKQEISEHLVSCKKCREYYNTLKSMKDQLGRSEAVDKSFLPKVMERLDKERYAGRRVRLGARRAAHALKPVFVGAVACLCLALGFWYAGSSMGLFEKQPNIGGQTERTTQSQTESQPEISETTVVKTIKTLTLYFPNSNADAVVPHERQVTLTSGDVLERIIFEELQKGPAGDGKDSIIPAGTKLISVETRDGICTLNLSSEFVDNAPGGTAGESMLINSIVNSLTELPGVEKVQFLINGEKREFYTHAVFDEPFSRNEAIIQKPEDKAAEQRIRERATAVLEAFRDKDMEKLSALVHPGKGVRFTPYAYIEVNRDQVFTAEEVKNLLKDAKKYVWGAYDGTGDPIELTFEEYLGRFVYDVDFLNADEIGYNKVLGQGNSINNSFEIYPEANIIEYHFPQIDPKYEGMDWRSLRLAFEKWNGEWYLVGVIHDEWTI